MRRDRQRLYEAGHITYMHDHIRPTEIIKDRHDGCDQRKLYDLIWKRKIACQMAAAKLERTTVDSPDQHRRLFCSTRYGADDDKRLPQVMQGEAPKAYVQKQLVKRMEERARGARMYPQGKQPFIPQGDNRNHQGICGSARVVQMELTDRRDFNCANYMI